MLLITKVVVNTVVTLGAVLALAAPVSAEPSAFGPLGCRCTPVVVTPRGARAVKDQVDLGIQAGLDSQGRGPANSQ